MHRLKKLIIALCFGIAFVPSIFYTETVKADVLDERVGALVVDTALSSYVDVLPSPEQVEQLGGVESWLSGIGERFRNAWENDNRNWDSFLNSANTLVNDSFDAVINVGETVLSGVRDVIHKSLNLIFGVEYDNSFDSSAYAPTLASVIADFNNDYARNPNENYCIICSPQYPDWRDNVRAYPFPISVNILNIYYSNHYSVGLNTSSSYGKKELLFTDTVYCLYWGEVVVRKDVSSYPDLIMIDMVNGANDSFTFEPTVNQTYYNNYYFGFGNSSNVAPNHIVNKYETVYNYVTNNYYTDAVREIKETPTNYYVSPVSNGGNGLTVNGFDGVAIELPNADGFGNLFGNADTSTVLALENSSWLKVLDFIPPEVMLMFFIALAVGCVCVFVKAVR